MDDGYPNACVSPAAMFSKMPMTILVVCDHEHDFVRVRKFPPIKRGTYLEQPIRSFKHPWG